MALTSSATTRYFDSIKLEVSKHQNEIGLVETCNFNLV